MGCEIAEAESKIPKLPLFSMHSSSPERSDSGVLTPPLQASASVPFRWEKEPGKPLPSIATALVTFSNPKCCLQLEPPPRLLIRPSPSFRISNNCSASHKGMLGALVLIKARARDNVWLPSAASWKNKVFKVKREVTAVNHVFPSHKDSDIGVRDTRKLNIKRSASLFHSNSRFWASICEGLKHVVRWKSKRHKKDGSGLN